MEPPNLFYRGSSMLGTFKPGDKLVIETVSFKKITKGDLIIFNKTSEKKSDFVAHRVVDVSPNGLTTRGDNCRDNDMELVTENSITGRVIKFDRDGKIRKARNGRLGIFRAMALHSKIRLAYAARRIFRKSYLRIRKSGFVGKWWRPEIKIIHFQTPEGPLKKFVHKGQTVAICWENKGFYLVKRLYGFLLRAEVKF